MQALITAGTPTGEVCHIRAQAAGGPRYDASQTDAERHASENLVIMCPGHHKVIDSDVSTYSVAMLQKMKADHEAAATATPPPPLTDEEATELLLQLRMNVIASINQSGGQTAHQIVNLYAPHSAAAPAIPPAWLDEKALSMQHSLLKSPPPAFIDVMVTAPSPIAAPQRLPVAQLTDAVIRSRVEYAVGFPLATDDPIERHQSPSGVFIAKMFNLPGYVESWSAFATGFFRLTRIPIEDFRQGVLDGKQPTEYLNWIIAIATIGEALVFALRFMDKLGITADFNVDIQFHGMQNRVLRDQVGALRWGNYQCNTPTISIQRTVNGAVLKKDATADGILIAKELFDMFHFDQLGEDTLRGWFAKLWSKQL